MRIFTSILALGAAVAVSGALATDVRAHASYNIAGYGAGIGGSTNGGDGMPGVGAGSIWTNGDPIVGEYTGSLPVMWYDGIHSVPTTRVMQTGGSTPSNGSLLQQTNSYNTANDPDLPTDRVLGVGGKSWSDPDNSNQGWGHGLDFGLIHVSPIDTLLANGPLKLTVSLQDDPTDGVSTRLAMAIYGHWDSSPSSSRHQTFVTDPAPTNDPLGATGLVLLGYAVGSASGGPVTLSIDVDATYAGEYTVLVGALGGVSGQYIMTTSLTADPVLDECLDDLASIGSCPADLNVCEADLGTCEAAAADADGDGVVDTKDACAATPAATAVDIEGCSRVQFCSAIDATVKDGKKLCERSDWKNDAPLMKLGKKHGQQDCRFEKQGKGTADDLCVEFVVVP